MLTRIGVNQIQILTRCCVLALSVNFAIPSM